MGDLGGGGGGGGEERGIQWNYAEYSGTPLLWTPWGPGEVSCIERCPHFRGRFILRKHVWDIAKCPLYKGVLISGVSFKRSSTVSRIAIFFSVLRGLGACFPRKV